jgi:hypothetical protein
MAELPRSRRNGSPTSAVEILDVLRAQRLLWSTEDELQRGLAAVLEGAGVDVVREVRLNARDRIDLLVDRVGIEVKVTGAWRDVERQLRRYLESDLLDELVLVTAKALHRQIPQGAVNGKSLLVHQLEASGL